MTFLMNPVKSMHLPVSLHVCIHVPTYRQTHKYIMFILLIIFYLFTVIYITVYKYGDCHIKPSLQLLIILQKKAIRLICFTKISLSHNSATNIPKYFQLTRNCCSGADEQSSN